MLPTRGVGWKYDLPPHDIAPAQREVCLASNLKINLVCIINVVGLVNL